MNSRITPEQLREVFLSMPDSDATRVLGIIGSLALVAVVLGLVRRRVLREEYTPIWLGVAVALVVVCTRTDVLHALTRAIGAWTTSSTIFFLGQIFLVVICLNYAVRLSKSNLQIKNLAQDLALVRARVDRMESADAAPGRAGG